MDLAQELGVSIRTLYRDIATLQGQGADIQGEPGLGYVLKPGFMLPPMMFSEDEIEAIVLGLRWVARRGDGRLGEAAGNAAAKIGAVLPDDLRNDMEASTLLVGPSAAERGAIVDLAELRDAIKRERKVAILYRDKDGAVTERRLWPFALGFFDDVRVVMAWCELRNGFRHFRVDRIDRLEVQDERAPRRRLEMFKAWRKEQGIEGAQLTTAKN